MQNENIKEQEGVSTVYEASFFLLPSLALEQVPAKTATLREAIEKAGGAMISGEEPVLIDTAYPMVKVVGTTRHKCHSGYFGWIKFEISTEGLATIKKMFDADADVLRSLIIKTVRENTLLNGKMTLKKEEKAKVVSREEDASEEVAEEKEAETSADLDKSIDDLVIA
jgi:ribosomal protein S6